MISVARPGIVASVMGAATGMAAAQAQFSQGSVHYSFDFAEYDTTTYLPVLSPNGAIEPGESAMIRMTMAYEPAYGTPVTYSTTIVAGSSGAGRIGGFWGGALNLNGSGEAEGAWILTGGSGAHRRGNIPPFSSGNWGYGVPNSSGTMVQNINPSQFAASVEALSTITGVQIWRGLWTPGSYAVRTVIFSGGPPSLPWETWMWAIDDNYTVNGFDLPVVGNVPATFGAVEIPIVPGPGAWVLIAGAAALGACRPRRRPAIPCRREPA